MAAEPVKVQLSVADDYLTRFSEVVERAEKAGLKVDRELKETGLVLGSIDPDRLPELERLEGVAAAERSREIRIAPPDSKTQ